MDKKLFNEIEKLKSNKHQIKPHREAMASMVLYLIFGVLWIFLSDNILNILVKDQNIIQKVQLFKGWLFVFLTGGIIYSIMLFRMKIQASASEEIDANYQRISAMARSLIKKDDEIYELSHYDHMTGLLNWQGLSRAFDKIIQESPDQNLALFYVDIDDIKHINETLGHENGNQLLKEISQKLSHFCHDKGILSRVSGDEFLMVFNLEGPQELRALGQEVLQATACRWQDSHYDFRVTSSIGIALYPDHGKDFDSLMSYADLAMFIAKDKGKNQFYVYKDAIGNKTKHYVEVVSQLRQAIEKDEFVLHYQPIIHASSNRLVGVEALIRWQHPSRGFLSPYHFIDIAEESGQISPIGRWVFDKACGQLQRWQNKGATFKMSINLSGKRLYDKGLVEEMKSVIKGYGLNPRQIQIEITETSVMDRMGKAIDILEEMRSMGITLALDDFGTGYSSLTYLQMFPIDVLKIDKDFIGHISLEGVEKENNIIDAIINLAHSMDLDIVAEGVESKEQAEYLLLNDCDYMQGYYFDKPMSAEDIEAKYF